MHDTYSVQDREKLFVPVHMSDACAQPGPIMCSTGTDHVLNWDQFMCSTGTDHVLNRDRPRAQLGLTMCSTGTDHVLNWD